MVAGESYDSTGWDQRHWRQSKPVREGQAHQISRTRPMESSETAAFGYLRERLFFEQRVRKGTFGYPRHAPSLTRRATVSC